jgi:hypothetical protein
MSMLGAPPAAARCPIPIVRASLLAAIVSLVAVPLAEAQAGELRATRAAAPPVLDGVLDDPAWTGEALPLTGWISYNPLRGEPASQTTRVWIAYDDRNIYFAFRCLDTEPDRIRSTIARRDSAWNDDWVAISLDSTRTGQTAYHMFVNPSGVQMDALNTGSNGEDSAPDWVWQSAGRVDAEGYSVEIALPLESIRFGGGSDVRMGVMFFRRISRLGVSWSWPEMPPGKWVFETHVPLLFQELRQPRVLEVIPSSTLSSNQVRGPAGAWQDATTRGSLGASLKYGLTSTITLDATGNPDFSQVESDAFEVEVNQRFPVFFSEKRPFFMEGLGLFNLAGTGGDATMRTAVHTRRIIDPSVGVKLTGTAGRQSFAFLSAADESVGGGGQSLFTIGRGIRNFGEGQYAGVLVSDVEQGAAYNRVIGGDVALRHGDNFRWNGSALTTHSRSADGPARQGMAGQASYTFATRRYTLAGQIEHYGRDFQMDTAFVNRVGITRAWQYQEVQFYPAESSRAGWIKRIAPFLWVMRATDRLQGGGEHFAVSAMRFNFTRQGFLQAGGGRGRETFAGRRFTTGNVHLNGSVQMMRWLSLGGSLSRGPSVFYDPAAPFQGRSASYSTSVGLQPNARLNHELSYRFVAFDRESTGARVFDLHIVNLRNVYQFDRRFFVRAIAQYDSSRRRVLGDFLASYELVPGTVIHAGYGSLLERIGTSGYSPTARAFFFKASYLARL